jgi:hypothetical protein
MMRLNCDESSPESLPLCNVSNELRDSSTQVPLKGWQRGNSPLQLIGHMKREETSATLKMAPLQLLTSSPIIDIVRA